MILRNNLRVILLRLDFHFEKINNDDFIYNHSTVLYSNLFSFLDLVLSYKDTFIAHIL